MAVQGNLHQIQQSGWLLVGSSAKESWFPRADMLDSPLHPVHSTLVTTHILIPQGKFLLVGGGGSCLSSPLLQIVWRAVCKSGSTACIDGSLVCNCHSTVYKGGSLVCKCDCPVCKGASTVCQSGSTVCQSASTVCQSASTVCQSASTVCQSASTVCNSAST